MVGSRGARLLFSEPGTSPARCGGPAPEVETIRARSLFTELRRGVRSLVALGEWCHHNASASSRGRLIFR